MNFDSVAQREELIEESFFVFVDSFQELHCGDDLEEIRNIVLSFYEDQFPENEEGERLTSEEFAEYVNNIKEEDLEKVEVKIKRPNYSENTAIISSSTSVNPTHGLPVIDYAEYHKQRVMRLLKGWNLEKDGKKVPVNISTIGSLHPNVIDKITNLINDNIPHYLSTLLK